MFSTHESPRGNLKLLCWLRTLAIVCEGAIVWLAASPLGIELMLAPLLSILAMLCLLNIATWLRLHSRRPITHAEFSLQLLFDMLSLAGLLYYTGGAANPFATLFILQVIIAAVALPTRLSWGAAFIAIALYTLLLFFKDDVPALGHHHDAFFTLHVQGMWLNFILLTLFVAWFVARMAASLRTQDARLAEAEHSAALGTLAASAAHELGTPLATMALLSGQYHTEAANESQQARAVLLMEHVMRCKAILAQMAESAGLLRADSGERMQLDAFLRSVVEQWQKERPNATLHLALGGSALAPQILADKGLEKAIANLLHNAADAEPHGITLEASWDTRALNLTITDKGGGIAAAIQLGTPGFTTKPQGLGLGLYLSKNILARFGGTLEVRANAEGGTTAQLLLPMAKLLL